MQFNKLNNFKVHEQKLKMLDSQLPKIEKIKNITLFVNSGNLKNRIEGILIRKCKLELGKKVKMICDINGRVKIPKHNPIVLE